MKEVVENLKSLKRDFALRILTVEYEYEYSEMPCSIPDPESRLLGRRTVADNIFYGLA